jgi:hypothetical protein
LLSFLFQLSENGDLKSVFILLILFIRKVIKSFLINLLQFQAREKRSKQGNEIATQTLESSSTFAFSSLSSTICSSIHPKLLQLLSSFANSLIPVVIIIPFPNPENSSSVLINPNMIRMSCPSFALLQRYGGKLFGSIKVNVCFVYLHVLLSLFILETTFYSVGALFYPFPAKLW